MERACALQGKEQHRKCGGRPPWQTLEYIGCVFIGCLAGSLGTQE